MSDIVHEGMNNFRIVKVELGDDKGWKDRYQVKAFPDFGVFVSIHFLINFGLKIFIIKIYIRYINVLTITC